MRMLKIILPATVVAIGVMATSTATFAKPEYMKKEGKSCNLCHVKAGAKELNEAGTYYKDHGHSLEGYKKK